MINGIIAVLNQPQGNFELQTKKIGEVDKDALVLKIELSGICGTDVHIFQGNHHGVHYPIVLGHEIVGTVQETGKNISMDYRGKTVAEGDRIILTPAMHCGFCYYCAVAKTPVRCVNATQYGFFSGNKAKSPFNGGYAQYLYIDCNKTSFFKSEISPEKGVLAEPIAVALHTISRVQNVTGATVVVQGAGALGLLHIFTAKAAGAAKVILVTRRKTEKLDIAVELGADEIITMEEVPDRRDRIKQVKKSSLCGYGADAVFECVGVPEVVDEGLHYLRDSGIYAIVGHAVEAGETGIDPADIMERNLRIEGIFDHSVEDFYKAFTILENNIHCVEKVISHRVPLFQIDGIFRKIVSKARHNGKEIIKAVLDPWI